MSSPAHRIEHYLDFKSKPSLTNDVLLAADAELPFYISCYIQVWRVGLNVLVRK